MVLLRFLKAAIGSDNLDVESNEVAWKRAQRAFEVVFSLIEAGAILGVLGAALQVNSSIVLLLVWMAAYVSVALYLLTGSSLALANIFEHFGWSERRWSRAIFRFVTFVISIMVPYAVSALASKVIVDALK